MEHILYPVEGAYHFFKLQSPQGDLRPLTVRFLNRYLRSYQRADFDLDGDIDQSDFGLLQACFSGHGMVQADPDCWFTRLDMDDDVDQDDVALFESCSAGPEQPVDPKCAR